MKRVFPLPALVVLLLVADPGAGSADAAGQKPGTVIRDCPDCPEMVALAPGRFRMGDISGRGLHNETPVHEVTIAKPFAIGRFDVTYAEWDTCVAAKACTHVPSDQNWGRGRRPVGNVNW